ncbi:hypothetical protein MKY91_09370 [Alkalicoccobacillus gibsonii]|uniref:DUF4083 domain-containing protein n=1 Tax=Alkalicoccobacillus gibsonii TaxID=79881 RepID=A0ABU9VI91_9BACI
MDSIFLNLIGVLYLFGAITLVTVLLILLIINTNSFWKMRKSNQKAIDNGNLVDQKKERLVRNVQKNQEIISQKLEGIKRSVWED